MLRPATQYKTIYVDVDDTLLQTTLTFDKFSKTSPKYGVHPSNGRWDDINSVMSNYNNIITIPKYDGADVILALPNIRVISSAIDIGLGRINRVNSLEYTNILFFNDDIDKIEYLLNNVTNYDLILDDKSSILQKINGETQLVNTDINSNAMSLYDISLILQGVN